MKSIEITFPLEGEIEVEANGFRGPACAKATADFIEALGTKTSETKKPEYYQADVAQKQKQSV